ncbi:MAG TPA: type VI secretion system protein TssA [Amaricoccus sp.]|uniref:type VI secretion system protein TssA n=2 Tax=Amaricoccus TaxID=56999 RepID=UPI002BE18422|nr:type VI secretion system protein TssA [Amaricoccus sp.]HRO11066.1 type VI secretion system protein TssA [Amaricoccus sp.]
MLDLAPWLSPLDGENPSGASLRDDPRFHEIERLMQPRVDVVRDDRNNPVSQSVIPVDWSEVLSRAEALRTQGRDLRLLVIVARALANERGLAGLADGLNLVAGTLEAHWDTLHPELRPGAALREAALRRTNALRQLNDRGGLLGDLSERRFIVVRGVDPVTGGDLERATLSVQAVVNDAPALATDADRAAMAAAHDKLLDRVNQASRTQAEKAPEELAALLAEARAAEAAAQAVEAAVAARLDGTGERVLPQLGTFLGRMVATLARVSALRAADAADAAAAAPGPPAPGLRPEPPLHATAAPAAATSGGAAVPDRLSNRAEVMACLDRIIEFYDRTEPASPVPYLARRMRRMVPMDFLELMEDLAPSGLKEFRSLAGLSDDRKAPTRTQGDKT